MSATNLPIRDPVFQSVIGEMSTLRCLRPSLATREQDIVESRRYGKVTLEVGVAQAIVIVEIDHSEVIPDPDHQLDG